MKRLQVLLLVSLASVLLFSGCGKKEEEADEPAVAQVIEKQPELENTELVEIGRASCRERV